MTDELTYILLFAIVCAIMMCCGMLAGIHDVLRNIDDDFSISNKYKLLNSIITANIESECDSNSE